MTRKRKSYEIDAVVALEQEQELAVRTSQLERQTERIVELERVVAKLAFAAGLNFTAGGGA